MSEATSFWTLPEFWITLLIVIAVVSGFLIFRGAKLKELDFKSGGIDAKMSTHEPPMPEIKGNILKGKNNRIYNERGDTHIRDNTLEGVDQEIDVRQPKS